MLEEKSSDGSQASESLYAWWLNSIPSFFGMAPGPQADTAAADTAADAQPASPLVGPIAQALETARRLLTPAYQASLQALLTNPRPEQAFGTLLEQVRTQLHAQAESLASWSRLVPAQGTPWPGGDFLSDPLLALGNAMKPLSLNLERAYGGLADAFGLASSRELQQAARELMGSAVARRQAQADYLAIVATALAKGVDGTLVRLRDMGQRGESVDSLLGLIRVWARSTDEAVHVAMQAPEALDASARLLRATTRSRQQLQRVVAVASAALNMPTRAEVDDAYREIQELKRELRKLRKASPSAGVVREGNDRDGEVPAPAKKAARKRAPAAKAARPRKATA